MSQDRRNVWRGVLVVAVVLVAVVILWRWRAGGGALPGDAGGEHQARDGKGGPAMESKGVGSGEAPAAGEDREKARRLRDTARRPLGVAAVAGGNRRECTFEAELEEGQSIVSGGYRTEDGRFEFTVLTPKRLQGGNGTPQFMVEGKLIVLDGAMVEATGLGSLTAGGGEGPQHAEAWTEDELQRTMARWLGEQGGSDMLAAPRVVTEAGMEFTVEVGQDGGSSYRLGGRVAELPNGKMAVAAAVSRVMAR